ncbi:hypothetical protein DFH28DRAFT_883607 [Melampsora americana]|nr:hypothetical protein DFH28DRAFT_883607 [Melampsora americana]
MSSTSICWVIFHLLILQASTMNPNKPLTLTHDMMSNNKINNSPHEFYQPFTPEEPNLELSLNLRTKVLHHSDPSQENKNESTSLDLLSMNTIPTNNPVDLDTKLSLSINNAQDRSVSSALKRKNLGLLESQNIKKSWLSLGIPNGSPDASIAGSTPQEDLLFPNIRNSGSQMLYQISGNPLPYSVTNAIYPPRLHRADPGQKLTLGPFHSWASRTVPVENADQLPSLGWGSGSQTLDQTSIGSDWEILRSKQRPEASEIDQRVRSETRYAQQDQASRPSSSNPSPAIVKSSEMPRRSNNPQPVFKGIVQGVQYQEKDAQETLTLEQLWIKSIESMGNELIDESPNLHISSWLNELCKDMENLWKLETIKIFEGYEITSAIAKSKERFSGTFLGCLNLLHQVEVQSNRTPDEMHQLINDGWSFIQRILNPWRISLSNPVASIIPPRKVNQIAGTQPLVIFFYLAKGGSSPIAIHYLWTFWKKWYRESSCTHKKFLATLDHFIYAIGTGLRQIGRSSISHEGWSKYSKMIPLDEEISHQDLLEQHCLQSPYLARASIHKPITQGELMYFAVHVGRFEVQLLEHHEAVEEYFDELTEELQTQLYNISPQDLKGLNGSIKKLIGNLYRKITFPFLGILRILHGNEFALKAKEKDLIISDGWRFLKTFFNQLKNINLIDLIQSIHLINPNEDHDSQTISYLSKRLLNLGDTSNLLLSELWDLYTPWCQSSSFITQEASNQSDSKSFETNLKSYYAMMHSKLHGRSTFGRGI